MEAFDLAVLQRLPLAEAVSRVLAFALDAAFLEQLYQDHRGPSYTRAISFPTLTRLVSDALFAGKSGRSTFEQGRDDDRFAASVEARYRKLGRVPPALRMALLEHTSHRLEALFPAGGEEWPLPAELAGFTAIVVDGKVSKGVPHRLKPLRSAGGGWVGGRSLVAYHLSQGRVLGFVGVEDGDANDVRFFPALAARRRPRVAGRRLWVADRQFGTLPTLTAMGEEDDAFVVRFSKAVGFQPDPQRPEQTGVDGEERPVREEWGWLGRTARRAGRYVRRLSVERHGQEPLRVLTSLLEADRFPAATLLEVYRRRADIESVFQRITAVFSLRRLIGTSPRATLFQLSLCLLLYNVRQLVRGYVARANDKAVDEVSPHKLLAEVREELIAVCKVLGVPRLAAALGAALPAAELRCLWGARLRGWQRRWCKAKRRRQRPPKPPRKSGHACAHRLLTTARETDTKTCS